MRALFDSTQRANWLLRAVALIVVSSLLFVSLTPSGMALAASNPADEQIAATGQSFFDDLTVESGQTLRGDVIVYNGDAVIESGGVIEGNLIVYSGEVMVQSGGVIRGDLTVWSGDVEIDGHVNGNISAVSGDVAINDGASVGGDVSTVSGEIAVEAGGSVGGNIVRGPKMGIPGNVLPAPLSILKGLQAPEAPRPPAAARAQPSFFDSMLALILRMFAAALVTLLITALVSLIFHLRPAVIERAQAEMQERLAPSFALGLAANVGLLFVIGLFRVICCLLPLAALPTLLLVGLNVIGLTVAARTVGQRLASPVKTPSTQPVAQVALGGMILVGALAFLWALTPFLRWPVALAALIIVAPGVGAFIRPWLNRERWNRPTNTPDVAGAAPIAASAAVVDVEPPVETTEEPSVEMSETVEPQASQDEELIPVWVESVATAEVGAEALRSAASESAPVEQIAGPPPPVDDFTRIVGIGRTWDQRLKMAGVTTFAQLASQTPESLAAILGVSAEQVIEDNLIGQAQTMVG